MTQCALWFRGYRIVEHIRYKLQNFSRLSWEGEQNDVFTVEYNNNNNNNNNYYYYYQLRHVCPSVRTEQLGTHRTDFHEIWYLSIFRKSVEKIQVSLKSGKNKGYFT